MVVWLLNDTRQRASRARVTAGPVRVGFVASTLNGALLLAVLLLMWAMAIVAFAALGIDRLQSAVGLERDGLRLGSCSPVWSLLDTTGSRRRSPSGKWQLLLFANHGLRSFQRTVAAIQALSADSALEIIALAYGESDISGVVLNALLPTVPIVQADVRLYRRYGVRVMPYAIVIDPEGRIRGSDLVEDSDHFLTLWRRATLLTPPVEWHQCRVAAT